MNHQEILSKASDLLEASYSNSLIDAMILVDFWKKLSETGHVKRITDVHKLIGQRVVDCVQHWCHNKQNKLFDIVLTEGLYIMDNPSKQVGDIVVHGNIVGVVRKIEGELFIIRTTDGEDLPFIAKQ